MAVGTRSILIVEELAHWDNGHFPVRCAQLAEAYAELGYRVELLTSEGWSRDTEHPQPPFAVRRYRRGTRWMRRLVACGDGPGRHQLLTAALVFEARAAAQQMVPAPDAIVVLGWYTDPAVVVLAGGRRRWLLNQFRDVRGTRWCPTRMLTAIEARRRAGSGCVRVAVDNETRAQAWAAALPSTDPVVTPVAGARAVTPATDARARLNLPARSKIALLFGEPALKRRDVVLDAFALLPDWTLVIGGRVADDVAPTANRVTFPGMVDDETRDLLFAAADVVVLSFRPNYGNDSGTLMDAIAFGVPVVCSEDATVARTIVVPYQLGRTFSADDPTALAGAVRSTCPIPPDQLAAGRRALSNEAVARRQLVALGTVPPA
jgi:hypothetical protein